MAKERDLKNKRMDPEDKDQLNIVKEKKETSRQSYGELILLYNFCRYALLML